jgi:hypothetical protein
VWDIFPTLDAPRFLGTLPGFPDSLLDDFCLTPDGASVVGCDWSGDAIMLFPALPTNGTAAPRVLVPKAAGLHHPTSARWGQDHKATDPFPATSLFVSEGRPVGYVEKKLTQDRLLRIDF